MDQLHNIELPDGRTLDVRVSGPENGLPLVFHHGTPGAGTKLAALDAATSSRGILLIQPTRAGYGGSSRHAGRTVVDVVDDTNAMLDFLGLESCIVAGWSGGGPHALACAARLDRALAALAIAAVAPHDAAGLDFLAGMGQDNLDEFGEARKGEAEIRAYLDAAAPGLAAADAAEMMAAMASLLPKVDVDAMTAAGAEYGDDMAVSTREAIRVGVDGWLDDDLAFIAPWGFDLSEIRIPTTIWQGSEDLMVPFAHGEWLGRNIPNVTTHLLKGEGHISVTVGALDQMLDELVELASA
jgi:pimeloyl-ACP methyl ester carboxylesterase